MKSWFPFTTCLLLSISSVAYGVPINENLNSVVVRGTLPPKFKPQPKKWQFTLGVCKECSSTYLGWLWQNRLQSLPGLRPRSRQRQSYSFWQFNPAEASNRQSHPRAVVEVNDRKYHPEDSVYDLVQRALGVTPSQVAANKNAPVQKQGPSTQALTDVLRKIGSPPDGQSFIPSIVECYKPRHRDRLGRPLIWYWMQVRMLGLHSWRRSIPST